MRARHRCYRSTGVRGHRARGRCWRWARIVAGLLPLSSSFAMGDAAKRLRPGVGWPRLVAAWLPLPRTQDRTEAAAAVAWSLWRFHCSSFHLPRRIPEHVPLLITPGSVTPAAVARKHLAASPCSPTSHHLEDPLGPTTALRRFTPSLLVMSLVHTCLNYRNQDAPP
jgi:hypothetical protein